MTVPSDRPTKERLAALVQAHAGGSCLFVRVQPRSKRRELAGLQADDLKIHLTSAPVEDRANRELVEFLSECLRVPKSHVTVKAGMHSRRKRVMVMGLTPAEVMERLLQYLG